MVGAIALVLTTTSGLGIYNLSVLLDAFVRAGASVCGRLAGGWILLKVPARAFTLVLFAQQAAALAVLAVPAAAQGPLNRGMTLAIVAPTARRKDMRALNRRAALALGLGTAAAWAGVGRARATPSEADEATAKFTGGKTAEPGRIAIDLPEIAENGTAVPLAITAESPMTASDRITDVLVVADGNPNPRVATFRFSPMSGRAEVATRIRLNATENVIVVARSSDGRFFTARKEVKVTIGGCGG